MKIEKKYYPYIAVGLLMFVFILFVLGGAKGKELQYDYVPLPKDGIDGV